MPTYAAIGIEATVECAFDLVRERRSEAFTDFFISDEFGAVVLDEIGEVFAGAYVEEWASGLYLSCFDVLNPAGVSAPNPLARSNAAARILASALSSGRSAL
jgi:hypothetical protein